MLRSFVLAATLLALLPLPVEAQHGRPGMGRAWVQQVAQRQSQGDPRPPRDADGRQSDRRNALTPDERRQLHRDLQRADREIYRKGRNRPQRQ